MIFEELLKLEEIGRPIRVGACGAGWMGSGFAAQMAQVPGMELAILADPDVEAARQAFLATGLTGDDIVETDASGRAEDAI
ncbi:MAG: NAD(P)-dependent oxidoreductase, partial [Chloroflexota bacterium]